MEPRPLDALKAAAYETEPYRLEAGRLIVRNGKQLVTLHKVAETGRPDGAVGGYTLDPSEADDFARTVVAALNMLPSESAYATDAEKAAAQSPYDRGEVRIEEDALTEEAGNGRWVAAWVWVSDDALDAYRAGGYFPCCGASIIDGHEDGCPENPERDKGSAYIRHTSDPYS